MDKYHKQIIYNYIKGNVIEEYTKEELEQDIKFMKLVLNITRDKNIYEKCSKSLKQNPEFIKHTIALFNNDIEFISKVMDEYIKISNDLESFTELIILMCKYTQNNKTYFHKYEKYRRMIYLDFKKQIETVKQEYFGTKTYQELGMGFIFILDYFNSSKITLNYFATNFISDIFNNYEDYLEDSIHKDFDTFDDLKEYGINKYLFSLINHYDACLLNYITINREPLSPILKKLDQIKKEWNIYPEKRLKKQYELMFEKVFDYLENIDNSTLQEVEIIYYLGEELGIRETLKQYDIFMTDDFYDMILSRMDMKIEQTKFNIYDLKYITNVKNIMIETLELKDNNRTNSNNLKQRVMKKILIKNNN